MGSTDHRVALHPGLKVLDQTADLGGTASSPGCSIEARIPGSVGASRDEADPADRAKVTAARTIEQIVASEPDLE